MAEKVRWTRLSRATGGECIGARPARRRAALVALCAMVVAISACDNRGPKTSPATRPKTTTTAAPLPPQSLLIPLQVAQRFVLLWRRHAYGAYGCCGLPMQSYGSSMHSLSSGDGVGLDASDLERAAHFNFDELDQAEVWCGPDRVTMTPGRVGSSTVQCGIGQRMFLTLSSSSDSPPWYVDEIVRSPFSPIASVNSSAGEPLWLRPFTGRWMHESTDESFDLTIDIHGTGRTRWYIYTASGNKKDLGAGIGLQLEEAPGRPYVRAVVITEARDPTPAWGPVREDAHLALSPDGHALLWAHGLSTPPAPTDPATLGFVTYGWCDADAPIATVKRYCTDK